MTRAVLAKPPSALGYHFPNIKPFRWSTLGSNLSQGLAYDKNSLCHMSTVISSLVETAALLLRYPILFDRR
ncbi:hypothetical protein BDR04DRAFT_1090846 [Suillus decipiens]|nr:hypothetical protein BDR04DRAFT_1090846 [Suillus decipiens]